jgi:hypothetical protein
MLLRVRSASPAARARRRARCSGSASPSPPRGRIRPARVEHVAAAEVDRPLAPRSRCGTRARAPVPPASATGRWPPPRRRGARPHGQRAGAAAGVQHARPCRSCRQPDSSVARMRSRPARTVARMRPTGASEVSRAQAFGRGAVEVGLDLAAALLVGWWSACPHAACPSVKPSRSKMSRSFIGTAFSGLGAGPQRGGQAHVFLLHGLQLGRWLHLEQRGLLQAAAADDVQVGEVRASFRPIAALYLSIWSVAALRLAITPPRRTL